MPSHGLTGSAVCGPQTLFMVIRLFSWSADSFHGPQTLLMVRRLVYSPLTGLSFVDLIIDGQHAFAGLVVVNLIC